MTEHNFQFGLQIFIGVSVATVLVIRFLCFCLMKKIDGSEQTYTAFDLSTLYTQLQKKYNLRVSLHFGEEEVPQYNLIEREIKMVDKPIFYRSDYIILLHEVSHAIDFSRKKRNMMTILKLTSVFGAIGCYLLGLLSLFYVSDTIGLLFVSGAIIARLVEIGVTIKVERDANDILLSDFLDGKYKLFVKLIEMMQIVERTFILTWWVIGFFLVRANIDNLR